MPSERPERATRARRPILAVIAGGIAIAVLLAGGYGLWYLFLRPAAQAAVGTTSVPLPSAAAGSAEPIASFGISGAWTVDTSIGSFSDFSGSFVGYRVQEELATLGGNIAVGRTPDVGGSLTIEGTTVTAVTIEADLTSLQSDDDRRDGQLRRQGIETGTYPTAAFALSSPIELGSLPADGQEVQVTAGGQLTLHGQTRDVQIPLTARLSGNVIAVTGSLQIAFADYGIQKPTGFLVLSIADEGTMEFQLLVTRS